MAANSSNINLQVSITNRQILSIALPITASIVVPQINFITNNIFWVDLVRKNWGWRVLLVFTT